MAKKIFIMTPFLTVIAAHTETMDKPYKATDKPKFKIRFDASPAEIKAFQKQLLEAAGNPKFTIPDPQIGVSVSKKGVVTILASSQYKPAMFDSKNNKLEAPKVGAGSIARANCALNVHDEGISLMLSQVQVKKLVEWSSNGESSAFGVEEDGYEGEASGFGSNPAGSTTTEADVDALGI